MNTATLLQCYLTWAYKAEISLTAMQDREVINIRINGANNGGLLSAIDGLPAFAPFSLVTKDVDKPFVTLEVRSSIHFRTVFC